MNLSERDRRALIILGVAAAISAVFYFWPEPKVEVVGTTGATVEAAAARLDRVRQEAAQLGVREDALKKTRDELGALEKGLISGDSQAQVQAQLLQVFRRAARAQSPAIDIKQTQFGQIRPFGENYAQVTLSVGVDCQIEQLINLISDLSAQPELLALEELHVSATNNKQKSINVQLVVSGLTRVDLIRQRTPQA